jgi:CheY-like chemotaxis protein
MITPQTQVRTTQPPLSGLARVLLVDADSTSRITLRAVLEAGGYAVRLATTTVEAKRLLEADEFELVLCNPSSDPARIQASVLSHARMQPYQPATALLNSVQCRVPGAMLPGSQQLFVAPQNLPELLGKIADMVANRAVARLEREISLSLS